MLKKLAVRGTFYWIDYVVLSCIWCLNNLLTSLNSNQGWKNWLMHSGILLFSPKSHYLHSHYRFTSGTFLVKPPNSKCYVVTL